VYENVHGATHLVDIKTELRSESSQVIRNVGGPVSSSELERKSGGYGFTASLSLNDVKPGRYVIHVEAQSRAGSQPMVSRDVEIRVLDTYNKRYVQLERADALGNAKYQISTIKRTNLERPDGQRHAFGDWFVTDVTTDTIERYREVRRQQAVYKDSKGADRISGGLVAVNRDLSFLRGCWNWAIRVGYLDKTPFKRGSEAVVRLSREPSRSRRLEKDEAERLLAACGSHLRSITEAALESGARKGELLSLQWWQVREGTRPELFFPAAKTKARRDRCVPISMRLKMILDMRRNDPSGHPMPHTAYVFGNEIGQRMTTIKTAWSSARRRAAITDLHFHDLRREAGSRWLEGGVPLQMIRDWLGHSNIAQTSTYLGSTIQGQHDAMRRFEERRAAAAAERPQDVTSHQAGGPILGERTSGARPKVQ
jgi:integrase